MLPTSLPLTRAANLADFGGLPSAAVWQQRHAVDAYIRWRDRLRRPERLSDLGHTICYNWGAGYFTLPWSTIPSTTYDRKDWPHGPLADDSCAIVYACSVLDRVEDPRRFLRQVLAALVPGGLFFATFAIWDATGRDVARGHALRARIYDRLAWKKLIEEVRGLGYQTFGGIDLRYPGDALGDHSLGSLVATKETA